MKKPTRAEVLAEYLGLTPETHPACYMELPQCFETREVAPLFVCPTHKTNACLECYFVVNMPDPLAPGTAADAWLGVLVRSERFCSLTGHNRRSAHYRASIVDSRADNDGETNDPTTAIVRAMMAADSTFAAQMEGATQ